MRICVYCASSSRCAPVYRDAARRLGTHLAAAGCTVVYGGGASGLMGTLADAALAAGGRVVGIIPRFMTEVEWQHLGVTELDVVEDLRERKHRMLTGSDAAIALPGGCGTLEELFEALSLKRLGLYRNPIVLLDTAGFYRPIDAFLRNQVELRFMNPEHLALWSLVEQPEDVLARIAATQPWSGDARDFAVPREPGTRGR